MPTKLLLSKNHLYNGGTMLNIKEFSINYFITIILVYHKCKKITIFYLTTCLRLDCHLGI